MQQTEKENKDKAAFTLEDAQNCWPYWREYFIDILNGEYDLEQAKNDLKGLIGTEHDKRTLNPQTK